MGDTRVKVQVLIWKNIVAHFLENTIPGDGLAASLTLARFTVGAL